MITKIAQVQTDDRKTNQLQSNIVTQFNALVNNPLIQGSLLKDVILASGSNAVNHKLGRRLIGWIVTRKSGTPTIYDTQNSNDTPSVTLLLTASGSVTVDLYVF